MWYKVFIYCHVGNSRNIILVYGNYHRKLKVLKVYYFLAGNNNKKVFKLMKIN